MPKINEELAYDEYLDEIEEEQDDWMYDVGRFDCWDEEDEDE